MARAVVLGATGYTGRLSAEAIMRRGMTPLLAGRSRESLDALRAELGGGLETAVASVERPESIEALLEPGDVLVTTVGPYLELGEAAVGAAIRARAHYVDTTGEGLFVRSVFEANDAAAREAGITMLPALGLDYVPGNLAGALALTEAGERAAAIEIAYFFTGSRGGLSRGTVATAATIFANPVFSYIDGELVTARPGTHVRRFEVEGKKRPALTMGSSEELWLPRLFPGIRNARVFQGGLGPATRPGAMMGRMAAFSPFQRALSAMSGRLASRRVHGPDEEQRGRTGTLIVAEALDASGERISRVVLEGPNVYDVTADLVAWGTDRLRGGEARGSGVMGPVEAFGLEELEAGCLEVGLRRAEPGVAAVAAT